jgi:DNA-binding transcriptional MerR regulator
MFVAPLFRSRVHQDIRTYDPQHTVTFILIINFLEVDVVSSEIQRFVQKNEKRLHHHENAEAIQLLDNIGIVRRLQRKKPFELP